MNKMNLSVTEIGQTIHYTLFIGIKTMTFFLDSNDNSEAPKTHYKPVMFVFVHLWWVF